jgi:hypothetical protein
VGIIVTKEFFAEGVLMVITYLGRVAVFCSIWTVCLGMSVDEKKVAATTLPAKGGVVEAVKTVEQFCRIISEQFGGPDVLCNANDKLAEDIKQYLVENKSVEFVRVGSVKDHAGRSPLAMAAQYGQLCLMQAFLWAGGEVNEPDNCGRTPLHRAVMITWDQSLDVMLVLKFLIKNGADPCLKTDKGQTPAQLAHDSGLTKAEAYLMEEAKRCEQAHEEASALVERLLADAESDESDVDAQS